MIKPDGGPAFPVELEEGTGFGHQTLLVRYSGMKLRDYFAAQAVVGILAKGMNDGTQWDNSYYTQVASVSYQMADAMIAERLK